MRASNASILGFVLLAVASAASAAGGAPITAVVLYPGSATIVRTAQVQPGAAQLVIPDLTAGFPLSTLRVESDRGIHVGQVVTQDLARTKSANPAEADLEARIQALRDQSAALDAEARAADIVTAYLERLGGDAASDSDRPRTPTDAKALAGVIEAIGRGANGALGAKQRIAVQQREIAQKIEALGRDLERLRSDARDRRTVTINLTAERAGAVRLSYQVNGAGWRPAYRAELDSAASVVALQRLAQVAQKTGEDWKDVRVSLTTSQPSLSPDAPSPRPWLLRYLPPRPAPQAAEGRARAYSPAPAAAPADMAAKQAAETDYVPPTFQTDGAFATEFEVPGRVTIPADGREVTLDLARQAVPVVQRVHVAPRLDRSATVTAQAERPAGVWLPGTMQIYRDGNYVGAAEWNPRASDKFVFSFGRDELLRVTFDQAENDTGSAGVFDKRNQRRIADRIGITSLHAQPIDVLVVEAAPVSTSDEITVEAAFDPKPSIEPWEQRRGVVAWEKTLRPNETATIGVRYTIDYPKEGTVTGLPY